MHKMHFSIVSVLKTQDCIPWIPLLCLMLWLFELFSNFYLNRDHFTNLMQDLDFCIFQNLASSFGGNEELGDKRWWFSSQDQVLFWYCLHRLCTKPFVGILNRIKDCDEGMTDFENHTQPYFNILSNNVYSWIRLRYKRSTPTSQELSSPIFQSLSVCL